MNESHGSLLYLVPTFLCSRFESVWHGCTASEGPLPVTLAKGIHVSMAI